MDRFDEWEIGNFSCWSKKFHGEVFKDETSPSNLQFYPRGIGGDCEHFLVRIHKVFIPSDSLLSFIGSDGSVICTRQSAEDWEENWIKFKGPRFEEVVAGIRRNEPMHKDRLTLRWKTAKEHQTERFRTVIKATTQFFQIKPQINFSKDSCDFFEIYNSLGIETQEISVKAVETGSTFIDRKVKLTLQSDTESKFMFRTSIWMVKGDNIIQKYEDYRIVDKGEHVLFTDIPAKELFETGFQTIMRCKIISYGFKFYRCYSEFMLPTHTKDFSWLSVKYALENTSTVVSAQTSSSPKQPELKPDNAVSVLLKDLVCLYKDQEYTDFEIRCGTVSFPTHRGLLSARSPVLKNMLSGDMREATCGHVDVDDLDPHTFGRFLAFLYSGSTGKEALQWEEASKLCYAADKYQVPSLKVECIAVLRDSVALENVCDILSLAEKHQDEELRVVAHEFLLKNFNEVLGSKYWEKLVMSDTFLVAKTLTHFAKINSIKSIPTNL